ncbi:MAG TPA: DUF1836 domain-containing protein [Clostridiaceae bacterium]|nr:DUF1836 domain-containing protein [Clostridiaceae bacterium]
MENENKKPILKTGELIKDPLENNTKDRVGRQKPESASGQDPAKNFEQALREKRPQEWDLLPDIELYMDQLLSYVNRQVPEMMRDQELTKSMVNNYIKQQIIPRPNGKRYTRQHIAELSYLLMLKEVLPIQQCKELFEQLKIGEQVEQNYTKFLNLLDGILLGGAEDLTGISGKDTSSEALRYALLSYVTRRIALFLINQGTVTSNSD